MKAYIFKNLFKLTLISSFVLTGIISPSANAVVVYNFVISDGVINTSGGIGGLGLGDLPVTGTFTATFTDTIVQFSDINLNTNPVSSFAFPYYEGTFDGFYFSGSQAISLPGVDDAYSGTFDGVNFNIAGVYNEPFFDGYQYSYTINASASPAPILGTFFLFISGLVFLAFKRHREI